MKGTVAILCSAVLSVTLLSGCSTTKVSYGDASEVETVTADFGSTDLQQIATSMVESLLSLPTPLRHDCCAPENSASWT